MILLVGSKLLRKIENLDARIQRVEDAISKRDQGVPPKDIYERLRKIEDALCIVEHDEDVGLNSPLEEVERSVEDLRRDQESLARDSKFMRMQLDAVWTMLEGVQKHIDEFLKCPDFSARGPAEVPPEPLSHTESPEESLAA